MLDLFLKHSLGCYFYNLHINSITYGSYNNHALLVTSSSYCTDSQVTLGVVYVGVILIITSFIIFLNFDKDIRNLENFIMLSFVSILVGIFGSIILFFILTAFVNFPQITIGTILFLGTSYLYYIFGFSSLFDKIKNLSNLILDKIAKIGLGVDDLFNSRKIGERVKQLQMPVEDQYFKSAIKEVEDILNDRNNF